MHRIGIGLLLGALAWAADAVQPFNVKPGLWEVTVTTQMSGAPPIPPDVLAKMTPEQRARLEAAMQARGSQSPKNIVQKHCIKQEDLEKGLNMADTNENCKRTVATSTGSKQEVKIACEMSGVKVDGVVRFEALDSEHVKFSAQMNGSGGGNTMTTNTSGTSKWLGAACGDVK